MQNNISCLSAHVDLYSNTHSALMMYVASSSLIVITQTRYCGRFESVAALRDAQFFSNFISGK